MATSHETYTARRLTVEVPGVREFQQVYEQAVPANPVEEVVALVERGASWAEVIDAHGEWSPHGFLIYWRNDVHGVMKLAEDDTDCIAYLMGNVTIAEQMFRHDPLAMLYAPLRTVIWEDAPRPRVVHGRSAERAVRKLRNPRGLGGRDRARQEARGAARGAPSGSADGTALLHPGCLIKRREAVA